MLSSAFPSAALLLSWLPLTTPVCAAAITSGGRRRVHHKQVDEKARAVEAGEADPGKRGAVYLHQNLPAASAFARSVLTSDETLFLQVEVEEEFLTNTLQKKLEKVGVSAGRQACCAPNSSISWPLVEQQQELRQPVYSSGSNIYWQHVSYIGRFCPDGLCRNACAIQLNKEKVDLENRLEAEQEYVVNKLCKQVSKGCMCAPQ